MQWASKRAVVVCAPPVGIFGFSVTVGRSIVAHEKSFVGVTEQYVLYEESSRSRGSAGRECEGREVEVSSEVAR